jgi:hypothetical protein
MRLVGGGNTTRKNPEVAVVKQARDGGNGGVYPKGGQ